MKAQLVQALRQRMPFGKYQGRPLLALPEPYLVWWSQQGFPSGQLGRQLALVYEIKLNGLEGEMRMLLANTDEEQE